jgi:hypothetical protein
MAWSPSDRVTGTKGVVETCTACRGIRLQADDSCGSTKTCHQSICNGFVDFQIMRKVLLPEPELDSRQSRWKIGANYDSETMTNWIVNGILLSGDINE